MLCSVSSVAAVFAHPDDVELAAFGTLGLLHARGAEITIVVATNGERSRICSAPTERVESAYVSSSLLAAKLELLDLPDGHLRHDAGTISAIESAVSELDPQLVVTHFPQGYGFGHQDHAALAHATTNVVLRKHPAATLLYAEPPTSAHGFAPNLFVDITDHFALKMDAIRHHGTEGGKHFMEPSLVEQRARWWAAQALGELATDSRRFEAFQLAKGMVFTPRAIAAYHRPGWAVRD
jgi:N-acetylglucosamine malate deacetylase 1